MTEQSSKKPGKAPLSTFSRGLAVQANVLGALIMRELHTRYGRDNIGYLWMILEPMTLAGMVALLHSGQKTHFGTDFRAVPFAIVGYGFFMMFRGIVLRSEGALESNQPLLYHRIVTIFDILLSRAVLEAAGTAVTFFILIGLSASLGVADMPVRWGAIFLALFYMMWFSLSVSMLVCAATYENSLVTRFVHPITYIMMPVSGAFYQLNWLPEPYRTWMSWWPMNIIFELARYGQFNSADETYIDLPYLTITCMIVMFTGLLSIRAVRAHITLR